MTLKVHHLRPAPGAKTAKTRKGRGEASKGKTAGRGTKGTKARYQVPARFEGGQMPLHMRLPKLKGFKNPNKTEFQVVNVAAIGKLFLAYEDPRVVRAYATRTGLAGHTKNSITELAKLERMYDPSDPRAFSDGLPLGDNGSSWRRDEAGTRLGHLVKLKSPKGGEPAEWPEDLRVREMPV